MSNIEGDLQFLRTIFKMAGFTDEDVEEIVKKAKEDPESYSELLKHFDTDGGT